MKNKIIQKMIIKLLILVSVATSLVTAHISYSGIYHLILDCRDESFSEFTHKRQLEIIDRIKSDFNVTNLLIDGCAFPTDGFRLIDFFNKLGIANLIKNLNIASLKSPLTREHLSGLSLQSLEFHDTCDSECPDDLLQNVKSLRHLKFSGNKFTKVPKYLFKYIPDIEEFEIMKTSLAKIRRDDFASFANTSLTNLVKLTLDRNSIQEIEEGAFNGVENIEYLNLSMNKLKSLPVGCFRNLKNLQRLFIAGNELKNVPADLLIENKNLKKLFMDSMRTGVSLPSGFFKGLQKLEIIRLDRNKLTSLPANLFSDLTSLKELHLSLNEIVELPVSALDGASELKILNLADNKLTSLPANGFRTNKLEKLILDNNKLTNITKDNLKGLNKLKVLRVSKNSLTDIVDDLCAYLNSLEEIDVSHNHLSLSAGYLPYGDKFLKQSIFKTCIHLKKLNAAFNNVSHLLVDIGLQRVEDINFSYNNITEIPALKLNFLHYNKRLNLANNKISSISLNEINLYGLRFVDIRDNPIHCDCDALDLARYMQEEMSDYVYELLQLNARKLKCASPPEMANRTLIGLDLSKLSCPVKHIPSEGEEEHACGGTCSCSIYSYTSLLAVDCSNRNLKSVPKMSGLSSNWKIELNMSGNELESTAAIDRSNLQNVVSLDLSSNKISTVTDNVLTESLQILKLHNNSISKLEPGFIHSLKESKQLEYISLHQNKLNSECTILSIPSLDQKKMFE